MYAFCRNSFVLFVGLVPLYPLYGFLDSSETDLDVIGRPGTYAIFPNYVAFLDPVTALSLLAAIIFLIGTAIYQRFSVQCIFSDLVALRTNGRGSPDHPPNSSMSAGTTSNRSPTTP